MIPKRFWLVLDIDEPHIVLDYFRTRREARVACKKFNEIQGYAPSCRVAAYDRSAESRGGGDQ